MIGRQVIILNRPLSMEELLQFMDTHWDKEQYNSYVYDKLSQNNMKFSFKQSRGYCHKCSLCNCTV